MALTTLALALFGLASAEPTPIIPDTPVVQPRVVPLGVAAAAAPVPDVASWHAVLVSGDPGTPAFDNGRMAFAAFLTAHGVPAAHIREISAADPRVPTATTENIAAALDALRPGPDDGCLFFLTSHGVPNARARRGTRPAAVVGPDRLFPADLEAMLDQRCAVSPTVVIVSACYSGVFAEHPALQTPNRVILTAAMPDRPSFGCSQDDKFTFWDRCMLETLPRAATWADVHLQTRTCVARTEAAFGFRPSEPQAWFGADVARLPLPAPLDPPSPAAP